MPELPTGTVSFLFTDIEGSTQAWERHPAAMRSALERHDTLLRGAIEAHGGKIFKMMGDACCAAFHTPSEALAAALDAQRALHAEPWSETGPLRVRMALHVGAAEARNGDYAGSTLNRVARLLAAGHGGQTLVSQAVYDLVRETLPEGITLRDLGAHSLKDLRQPVQIYQLVHPGLPAEFPPLKSLDVLPNNLPTQPTSFIGREREMAEIKRLLASTNLLTLTGAGGNGKTRLALQVAADLLEEYPDGVWLVDLAALVDPALVPQALASALGVREHTGRSLSETLAEYLKPRKALIVLDNCEHVLEGCLPLVALLLRACPGVKVLATSREALNVPGEASWTVAPLSAPDPKRLPEAGSDLVPTLSRFEGIRLFVERAALGKSDFALTERNAAALAQICHRLDGIPLAIELAAARVKVMSVEQIATRLDDRFRLLTGGSRMLLPRHQTLRAAMDWSYDLLEEGERVLLRRLSVFAGGWVLEAAEAVCGGEGVEEWEVLELQAHLVEKSLVTVEESPAGETHYRMLGTVRQYARDRLVEAGEATGVRDRHRDWFLDLAERGGSELRGPDQAVWLERLEQEHDNLRAALEWSQADAGGAEAGLQLAGALYRFWHVRGYLTEGRQWLEGALTASTDVAALPRAKALHGAGYLAWAQADVVRARSLLEECLAMYRELGDKRGLARALNSSGLVPFEQGDLERAAALWEQGLSVAREIEARDLIATLLNNLGEIARIRGDYGQARALYEEALGNEVQGSTQGRSIRLFNLGFVACAQGDYEAARSFFTQGLVISRQLGDRVSIASCLEGFAGVYAMNGEPERAARLLGAGEALRKVANSPVQAGDRDEYDRFVAAARSALGEEAFAAALVEGHALSLEEAIELALGETPAASVPQLSPVAR
jgi:predicted ATPase/class 3 adenylate cyclase/Tfp pilus assembly protein PilF